MVRKLVIELPDGSRPVLEQVPADHELQLQEQLKNHPELLPLDELGMTAPAVVVGRESVLDSGAADLVLLGNGGDLALVEFKTGPQNPDFRACLAQLLDYGSDLWGMSLEEFESRVAQRYFKGPHCPKGSVIPGSSLDDVLETTWGAGLDDAVDWRGRLQQQLRDGSFHYIAVAQRFTPPMLQTLRYLNATMRAARFSAVELIRFQGDQHSAFEARWVAGAEPSNGASGTAKAALAGVEELVAAITDDGYRHELQDLFDMLATLEGMSVFWGTTGCSLRVQVGDRPLSVGWIFPPGPPRWMGLTDVTLGWYQDANGLNVSHVQQQALDAYLGNVTALPGATTPKSSAIHGSTFPPDAFVANAPEINLALREVVTALVTN